MSTGKAFCIGKVLGVLAVLLFAAQARAHPVALGALDITVKTNELELSITVSTEEVLVANSKAAQSASLAEQIRVHGDYLLRHFRVTTDRAVLSGEVIGNPVRIGGRPVYKLRYPLSTGSSALTIEENVLREIAFAPGNPWEASFVVNVSRDQLSEGGVRFLSSRQPVSINLDGPGNQNAASRWDLALSFIRHGIMHILTGYDHLLFVGALVLAVRGIWDLIKVISAFTFAHTITLTLAALDIFRLPARLVEPMIAASIIFVAVQNLFWAQQSRSPSRLIVAFLFGLFHGLGFAGALLDAMSGMSLGLEIFVIAAFSVGVEIGHQIVVLPVFGCLRLLRRSPDREQSRDYLFQRYGSAIISICGLFYFVEALGVQ